MSRVVLAETLAESKRILKSDTYWPTQMAEQYRHIEKQLSVDFSPTIRLLELLPVFLSGERHATFRRQMAVGLAAVRDRQEQVAQQLVERLPACLTTGRTTELMDAFIRPLWMAIATANEVPGDADGTLATEAPNLFDGTYRLRERVALNERIRHFIESDPDSAERRLVALGQNVLGAVPLMGTLALSLHKVFTANLGTPMSSITYPERFPASSLPVTDRVRAGDSAATGSPDKLITRCVLHSTQFTPAENDEALYGMGEHTCLGRPIANAVWTMVIRKLASIDAAITCSKFEAKSHVPETPEDFLGMSDPFVRPISLRVTIG